MKFKSSMLSVVFRGLAAVSVIGASAFGASVAIAALSPAQQTQAAALASQLVAAINAASQGSGNQELDVIAAIQAQLAGIDPLVANAALASAAKTVAATTTFTVPGVKEALTDQQTVVLAQAIVAASNAAAASGGDVQAAVSDVVATASVSPAVASAAFNVAVNSGNIAPGALTTVTNLASAVQTLQEAGTETGTVQVAQSQPGETTTTSPFYVG